jgi:hypothetical protein
MGTPEPPPLLPDPSPTTEPPQQVADMRPHNPDNQAFGRAIRRRLLIGGVFILLVPLIIHFSRTWLPKLWENLHLVNFIVAGIPSILSILFAFVIDKDLEHHMRMRWRWSIVGVGLLYSTFLWHQQALSDEANTKQTNDAVTAAVTQANTHSDQKFLQMQTSVTDLGKSLGQNQESLQQQLNRTESDLDASIGKVGKPITAVPARLIFSLWNPRGCY